MAKGHQTRRQWIRESPYKDQELSSDREDDGFLKSVVATPPTKKLKVDYEKNSLHTAIQLKKIGGCIYSI